MSLKPRISSFRIHGDNVIECEKALSLLSRALKFEPKLSPGSVPYAPVFKGISDIFEQEIQVHLLPGHGRWGLKIALALLERGSSLRENADAVITAVHQDGTEEILLAVEFCGALPAGNNAWQRHGRALGFGQAGIPYLIYNEIGGMELNRDRTVKASRFPNPAAPFSLIQFSRDINSVVLPVYEPAPSASIDSIHKYGDAFGGNLAVNFIRLLLSGESTRGATKSLEDKAMKMVSTLCDNRSRTDGFNSEQWHNLLNSGNNRLEFFIENAIPWSPKSGKKVVVTKSASTFLKDLRSLGALSMGSSTLPFMIVPQSGKASLGGFIESIYGELTEKIIEWIFESDGPIVIVLVTGFKPTGEDSRPDRGLVPLARMLAGPDALILTLLWGPAKHSLVQTIFENTEKAIVDNGLVQSVTSCSDMVLVDTVNHKPFVIDSRRYKSQRINPGLLVTGKFAHPAAGEHDIDSLFHFMLKNPTRPKLFEGMCNPPGGDWSGISIEVDSTAELRWTSLPRVSSSGAKRPDHVIQLRTDHGEFLIAVESKQSAQKMESAIGPKLIRYTTDLLKYQPTIERRSNYEQWKPYSSGIRPSPDLTILSMGIFVFRTANELTEILYRSELDLVGAFEFKSETKICLHMCSAKERQKVAGNLRIALGESLFDIEISED